MEDTPCPRCQCKRIVLGRIYSGGAVGFTPRATRRFSLSNTVPVDLSRMYACTECGLLWTELRPSDLTGKLTRGGTAEALAWLEGKPDRPLL